MRNCTAYCEKLHGFDLCETSIDNLTMRRYNIAEVILLEKSRILYSAAEKADAERDLKVYKADELVQKARYSLSLTEQRFLLYAISKIQPGHDAGQEYELNLADFQRVCGSDGDESYSRVKAWIKHLADKSWWMAEERSETLVRWFSTVRIYQQSGVIAVKFHEDMFPYLFRLAERMRESGKLYTSYTLRYVLPMKSTYSIRLYELLKSYQKNNESWWFELDKLRHLLDCENYSRFPDLRRYVLEPAVREINQYTDMSIDISFIKEGRKVKAIEFKMLEKDFKGLLKSHHDGLTELEGNVHYWDIKQTNV